MEPKSEISRTARRRRSRTKRWGRASALVLVVMSLAVGGTAVAQSPDSITACVHKTTGAVRIVEDAHLNACKATELEVTWNQEGLQGPQGETGAQGVQGEKGDTGDQGVQGEKGDTGDQGVQGVKGDTGDQGIQGEKGDTGDQGLQGIQGEEGPIGPVGPQGPQGEKGDTGETGETGAQGPQGETGAQGPQGETGAQGPQGQKGDTGATGAQGPQGETGATGAQGPQGDQGVPGLANVTVRTNSSGAATTTATKEVTASCLTGEVATGGGHALLGDQSQLINSSMLVQSLPLLATSTTTPVGWTVKVSTQAGGNPSWALDAYVVCATVAAQ